MQLGLEPGPSKSSQIFSPVEHLMPVINRLISSNIGITRSLLKMQSLHFSNTPGAYTLDWKSLGLLHCAGRLHTYHSLEGF